MILDTVANTGRYESLHPCFRQVFDYIHNTDLSALAPGRYPIVDQEVFAIVEHVTGRARETAKLECHRKYIDIQLVLEGVDEMGWKPLSDCHDPVSDYRAEKDIQFFNDAPATWVATPAGAFCIFFPQDAHAPLVSSGHIRKVIFKIAVNAAP